MLQCLPEDLMTVSVQVSIMETSNLLTCTVYISVVQSYILKGDFGSKKGLSIWVRVILPEQRGGEVSVEQEGNKFLPLSTLQGSASGLQGAADVNLGLTKLLHTAYTHYYTQCIHARNWKTLFQISFLVLE